jgi:hypothetical protein
MHETIEQHEEVTIQTGLKAGDGPVIGGGVITTSGGYFGSGL